MSLLSRWLGKREAPAESDDAVMAKALAAYEAGHHQAALALWRPLAERGHARACNNLGWLYSYGRGVPPDPAEAMRWIRRAAEAGDPVGQTNYAFLHYEGNGVKQDFAAALAWYRRAAEAGEPAAQDMLSFMLLEGLS